MRCRYSVIELPMCLTLTNASLLQVFPAAYGATVFCSAGGDTGLLMERNLGYKYK